MTDEVEGRGEKGAVSEKKKTVVEKKTRVSLDVRYEVLALLPEGFLHGYEQLWVRMSSGRVRERDDPNAAVASVPSGAKIRMNSGERDARGSARAGGKRAGVSARNVIADVRAAALKARVDRALRKLGRDMREYLDKGGNGKASVRRCTRCRGWAEDNWAFCPRDGAATEEVGG